MPLLYRKRLLAAALESPVGSPASLTNSNVIAITYDPVFSAEIEMIDRPRYDSFGLHRSEVGLQSGTVTFKTELKGDGSGGSQPAWADVLFPACGFVFDSGGYVPKSIGVGTLATGPRSATIGIYQDGVLKQLAGACGTFKIVFETGKPIMIEWTFTGKYVPVSDAAMLTEPADTVLPIRFAKGTFGIGSWQPCVQQVSMDSGNSVIMRPCQSATDESGYTSALITDRKMQLTANPEMSLTATEDVYGKWLALATDTFTLEAENSTDKVSLSSTVQRTAVSDGDREGLFINEVTLLPLNDSMNIEFETP